MNGRRISSSLLNLMLVLLLALGPWPVIAGQESNDGCCAATTAYGTAAAHGCCDESPENRQQQSCGDPSCPATHCSALSFLPSSEISAHSPLPPMDTFSLGNGYTSYITGPSTPPPVFLRLS
jgi:hypothetical protein